MSLKRTAIPTFRKTFSTEEKQRKVAQAERKPRTRKRKAGGGGKNYLGPSR